MAVRHGHQPRQVTRGSGGLRRRPNQQSEHEEHEEDAERQDEDARLPYGPSTLTKHRCSWRSAPRGCHATGAATGDPFVRAADRLHHSERRKSGEPSPRSDDSPHTAAAIGRPSRHREARRGGPEGWKPCSAGRPAGARNRRALRRLPGAGSAPAGRRIRRGRRYHLDRAPHDCRDAPRRPAGSLEP